MWRVGVEICKLAGAWGWIGEELEPSWAWWIRVSKRRYRGDLWWISGSFRTASQFQHRDARQSFQCGRRGCHERRKKIFQRLACYCAVMNPEPTKIKSTCFSNRLFATYCRSHYFSLRYIYTLSLHQFNWDQCLDIYTLRKPRDYGHMLVTI